FCHNRSETRFLPAGLQSLKPVLIQPGEPGLFYSAEHYGADYFWILTNHKAPHGKLVQAKIANPGLPFWIPAVIYPDSTILKAFTVINMKFLLLLEQKSFRASVRIVDLTAINDPSKGNKINFNDPEGELVFDGYEAESGKALIRYSSLLTPATLYTYDLEANKLGIRWQVNIHGYAKENYGARTLMIKSKDGFSIPVTIIFNKDFEMRDGSSPLLLVSGDLPEFTRHSQFNASWLSLLDRGFYIAVIHLPDDSETGDTLINNSGSAEKKNTNREFTDCINFLVSEKYTSLGKIAAIGIFSGGMALLDAVNNYPGLIKGVVLDQSLTTPLPASIAEKRAYPPLFLYAGKQDSGRYALAMIKMTALLRKNKTDKNILLFTAGNAVSNKGDYACGERELPEAEQAAFILSCLGIKK
ncbi:MAG: prolyl oligopeptidase family serine peptidase, partial [Bacteroidota bacterium]